MPLDKYIGTRMVVLSPDTNLYEAARAMEENHIGAVVVRDHHAVVGIVTDRDLALEVIAYDLDPYETKLRDVLSAPVALLPPTASTEDAALLMLHRHVRRIPIVDGDRLVGLVSLDDLVLDQAVEPALLAAIVRAQLSESTRLKRANRTRPSGHVSSAKAG